MILFLKLASSLVALGLLCSLLSLPVSMLIQSSDASQIAQGDRIFSAMHATGLLISLPSALLAVLCIIWKES